MSSQSQAKPIKECDYGERCYRKNPAHFQEYTHSHLNHLLQYLEKTGSQHLPDSFKPKISRETIREQLIMLKNISSENIITSSMESLATSSVTKDNTSTLLPNKQRIPESPTSSRKRQTIGDGNENETTNKKTHLDIDKPRSSSASNKVHTTNMSNSSSTCSSKEHQKRMEQAQNMTEAMSYFQEVKKRSKGNIYEKHQAAAPYYFFLTSVTDSKKTHIEPLSLQMFDILDHSLGNLESSLQINFMVEFGWLMAQYHVANQSGKPITILYGEMDVANLAFNNVTAVKVKPPSPFGSHHTKMCVLSYTDGSVRVCVHTANLVESDWDNRVQGVWLSPLCPALPLGTNSDAGEAPTKFKHDLIQYMSSYRLPELQPWIGKLRRADFSHINVFFVASTPGSHKGVDSGHWGHTKLASLLSSHVTIPPKSSSPASSWPIIVQCSSIGSLGPQPTSWFCGEIKNSMSREIRKSLQSPPPMRLIYPSFENVSGSYDGLLGGGCLPYSRKTHEKQSWLQQYLYQWKSDVRHRTRAVPHIKTYTRVSPDLSHIVWFHLTSANMSKAAWGSVTKAGATSILSYEVGVLFLPKFVLGQTNNTFPIRKEVAGNVPVFSMPYDLPLTQYSSKDIPWFIDNLA